MGQRLKTFDLKMLSSIGRVGKHDNFYDLSKKIKIKQKYIIKRRK